MELQLSLINAQSIILPSSVYIGSIVQTTHTYHYIYSAYVCSSSSYVIQFQSVHDLIMCLEQFNWNEKHREGKTWPGEICYPQRVAQHHQEDHSGSSTNSSPRCRVGQPFSCWLLAWPITCTTVMSDCLRKWLL